MRRRWDRRSALGAPGSIMAGVAKRNMLRSNVCYTIWGFSVVAGRIGWTVEISATIRRIFLCSLTLDGVNVSVTLFKVGPRGPVQ